MTSRKKEKVDESEKSGVEISRRIVPLRARQRLGGYVRRRETRTSKGPTNGGVWSCWVGPCRGSAAKDTTLGGALSPAVVISEGGTTNEAGAKVSSEPPARVLIRDEVHVCESMNWKGGPSREISVVEGETGGSGQKTSLGPDKRFTAISVERRRGEASQKAKASPPGGSQFVLREKLYRAKKKVFLFELVRILEATRPKETGRSIEATGDGTTSSGRKSGGKDLTT